MQEEGKILPDLSTNKQETLAKIGISMDLSNKNGDLANDICLFCKFMGPRTEKSWDSAKLQSKPVGPSFIKVFPSLKTEIKQNKKHHGFCLQGFTLMDTPNPSKVHALSNIILYPKLPFHRIVNSYIPLLDKAELHSVLVGGIPTPLKNTKVSWDDYSQYMESHKIHVPNHQPVLVEQNPWNAMFKK